MEIDNEYHPQAVFVLPSVVLERGDCGDESCTAKHFKLTASFLVWSVSLTWSTGG